jgi:hypothetical protein
MNGGSKKHNIKHFFGLFFSSVLIGAGLGGVFIGIEEYPQAFATSAFLVNGKKDLEPTEEIVINFSHRVLADSVEKNLTISPKTDVYYHWSNTNKTLAVSPRNYWRPQSEYKIEIKEAKSIFLSEVSSDVSFRTTSYPQISNFYPEKGAKDVKLDIEDPIVAQFTKPLGNFRIKFTVDPFVKITYQLDQSETRMNLMPEGDLAEGQKYEIKIYIKYKDEEDSAYRLIHETSFETFPPVPKEWDKNFTVRLEQSRKFTKPQITEGKYIDINLKSQVLTVFENGQLLDVYLISTGKRGMETPQGKFRISNKTRRAWSAKYGLYMPYWMALVPSGDFGIHELPEWPGGYKEGANHLGTPVSHGCVRLGIGPAERVYKWADLGTPVVVHE